MGFIQNLDKIAPGIVDLIASISPSTVYGEFIESTGSEPPSYYSKEYGYVNANNVKKITKSDREQLQEEQAKHLQEIENKKAQQTSMSLLSNIHFVQDITTHYTLDKL